MTCLQSRLLREISDDCHPKSGEMPLGKNIDNLLGLSVSCEILDLFIAVRAGLSQLEQGGQWC